VVQYRKQTFIKEKKLNPVSINTKINLEEVRKEIKLVLLRIGVRCDFSGFNYLTYGVELVIQNPNLINFLCTELYVKIAEHFEVQNIDCIERSMRHAISYVEKTKGFKALNDIFHAELYTNGKRPTTGELIQLLTEYYNAGLYKEIS